MRQRIAVAAAFLLAAGLAQAGQKVPPRAGTEGNGVWSSHAFVYDGAGNITAIGDDVYVYDSAGRLVRGTANGPANRQDYAYDSFGNRLRADTTGAPCAGTVTCGGIADVDWRTNRLRDHNAGYDEAGNLTRYDPKFDPANPSQSRPFSYAYDGAGMVSSITAPDSVRYEYIYTVDDERLAINTNGGNWRFTVRDLSGRVIREVNAYVGSNGTTWLWDRDHVFRDTALLATISATGTQQFHLDHIGTPRVVTDAAGGQLGTHAYYPYGEELNLGPQENPEARLKFTGHERDAIGSGGLDYMHARYYAASSGRFLSVDPVLGNVSSPQSWNRYTYVGNNPVLLPDPRGQCPFCILVAAAIVGGLILNPSNANAPANGDLTYKNNGPADVIGGAMAGEAIAGMAMGQWHGAAESATGGDQPCACTPTRDINNPNSFRGADSDELKQAIPESWKPGQPTRSNDGERFFNPDKRGEGVRIMPGDPNAHDPGHAGPYAKFTKDGEIIHVPLKGNPTIKLKDETIWDKIVDFFTPASK